MRQAVEIQTIEEARYIAFFINWMAWSRVNRPWWRGPAFRLRCLRALMLQAWKRFRTARCAASKDNFTRKGASSFDVDVDPKTFFFPVPVRKRTTMGCSIHALNDRARCRP